MRAVHWVLMAVWGAGCAHASTASGVETRDAPTPTSTVSAALQELREQQATLRDRVMPEMRRRYVEGEYARALELLDELVKRGVDDLQVRMAMASAAHRLGQHETALRHARAAHAHATRDGADTTMTGLRVGQLLAAIGKEAEALVWLQALLVEHPDRSIIGQRIRSLGGTPALAVPLPSLPARWQIEATLSPAAPLLVGCAPTGMTLMRIHIDGPKGRGRLVSATPPPPPQGLDCLEATIAQLRFPVFRRERLEIVYPIEGNP